MCLVSIFLLQIDLFLRSIFVLMFTDQFWRSGQVSSRICTLHIHEIESDTEINFKKSFVKRINDDELMDSTGHTEEQQVQKK